MSKFTLRLPYECAIYPMNFLENNKCQKARQETEGAGDKTGKRTAVDESSGYPASSFQTTVSASV
ncbi:hypothetical protein ACTXT7_011593 [Hymenolepis weldensis]